MVVMVDGNRLKEGVQDDGNSCINFMKAHLRNPQWPWSNRHASECPSERNPDISNLMLMFPMMETNWV